MIAPWGTSGEPRHDPALVSIVGWVWEGLVKTSEEYARYKTEGLMIHGRHTRLKAGPIIATSSVEVINERG